MRNSEQIAVRAYALGLRTGALRYDEVRAVLGVWNRAQAEITEEPERADAALDQVEDEIRKWEARHDAPSNR